MKKIGILLAAITIALSFVLGSCAKTTSKTTQRIVPELVVSEASIVMEKDKTTQLLAYSTTGETVTFLSEDEGVVVVSAEGAITAVSLGETKILIKCGDLERYCKVSVVSVEYVIKLDCESAQLGVGTVKDFRAFIYKDGKLYDGTVTWAKTGVGAISVAGNTLSFEATEVGEATITATFGDTTATCSLTVVNFA